MREIARPPKASAVKALVEKFEGKGFDRGSATALARTAVDPADVRRRLERPTPIRVPGALLWVVEADVWTPTVVPYVVNYREAAGRVFPADATVPAAKFPEHPPIRRPSGDHQGRPVLDLQVNDEAHLVHAIESSVSYLVEHNPLGDSIEEKGVMFPITLVCTAVDVAGGKAPIHLPATADGSSRASGALDVLGIGAEEIVGRFRSEPRDLAALIGRVRSIFGRSTSEVSEAEFGQANALTLPARIIVGFDPDAAGTADFAKAVHNYVQLIHGDLPPTPWSATAKVDAKADSVVAELERWDLITLNKALYLEGMLDPAQARKLGFPATPDERGLVITSLLSKKGPVHAAIKAGVVQASDRKKLTKKAKSEICAELALRSARGGMSAKEASIAREVLANIYGNPLIWEQGLEPSDRNPDELLAEALKERKAGKAGVATAELAALGGFWLVVHRVLREPRFFKEEDFSDSRTPSAVLTALMDSDWGLRVLAQAVVDGREARRPARVDAKGSKSRSARQDATEAHHAWLRGKVVPPAHLDRNGSGPDSVKEAPRLRERILNDRRKKLEEAIALVEQRHVELREPETVEGSALVDDRGLPSSKAEELRERLEVITRALVVYGARWTENSEPVEEGVQR
ncbi:MAG TPA: hypothetical protein VF081_10360 [Solirubrobacterales bacterium]